MGGEAENQQAEAASVDVDDDDVEVEDNVEEEDEEEVEEEEEAEDEVDEADNVERRNDDVADKDGKNIATVEMTNLFGLLPRPSTSTKPAPTPTDFEMTTEGLPPGWAMQLMKSGRTLFIDNRNQVWLSSFKPRSEVASQASRICFHWPGFCVIIFTTMYLA